MSTGTGTLAGGKPLSYCQNLEDHHLWLALGGDDPGVYIDIGAGHPIADNVSMWFYERGWRGLVVEPQPALAALYPHVRPRDIVHEGLVGRENGAMEFFAFPRLHGLSTTVASQAEAYAKHGDVAQKVSMPVTTLASLCEQHGLDRIDFLKIDVEGAEADVLAGNDWDRYRPKVIVAEAYDLNTQKAAWDTWEPILLEAGYRFRLDDTLNRFYVARECPEVFERLPDARGDWGAVTHMYEIGKAPEEENHPEHELAVDLARGLWASLPLMEAATLAALIARARGVPLESSETAALIAHLESEQGLAALARIACGYDGGQL